jgi:FkbM family methyltransferase
VELYKDILEWHLPLGHERELIEYIRGRLPRTMDTFVDIGANVGTWTLNLHDKFRKVIAFEPFPAAHYALCQNLKLNGITNVHPSDMAVSDTNSMVDLTHFTTGGHSTLLGYPVAKDAGEYKGKLKVDSIRLDTYFTGYKRQIDMIKMDTEGSELDIIRGGLETIKKHEPILVIEIHDKSHVETIFDLLPDRAFEKYEWNGQLYLLSY